MTCIWENDKNAFWKDTLGTTHVIKRDHGNQLVYNRKTDLSPAVVEELSEHPDTKEHSNRGAPSLLIRGSIWTLKENGGSYDLLSTYWSLSTFEREINDSY